MNPKLIGAVVCSLVLLAPMVAQAEKAKKSAGAKVGVTTGDDDDINDLEVQRKARQAPGGAKAGKAAKADKAGAAQTGGKTGVTTGDDDDINDLEVQRKARQAPGGAKAGKAPASDYDRPDPKQ